MDVTVCVATFGAQSWQELAESRAVPSALGQAPVIRVHGPSLHEARNEALAQVRTEWVIFLDADDELTPGYVDAMRTGSADLRAPSLQHVLPDGRIRRPRVPRVWSHRHACTGDCLPHGNWLVIGTCARTELLRQVGGFEPWPVYEDWALWLRCWKAGATVEAIPRAVYRAWYRPDSRNHAPPIEERGRVHRQIVDAVFGDRTEDAAA